MYALIARRRLKQKLAHSDSENSMSSSHSRIQAVYTYSLMDADTQTDADAQTHRHSCSYVNLPSSRATGRRLPIGGAAADEKTGSTG